MVTGHQIDSDAATGRSVGSSSGNDDNCSSVSGVGCWKIATNSDSRTNTSSGSSNHLLSGSIKRASQKLQGISGSDGVNLLLQKVTLLRSQGEVNRGSAQVIRQLNRTGVSDAGRGDGNCDRR